MFDGQNDTAFPASRFNAGVCLGRSLQTVGSIGDPGGREELIPHARSLSPETNVTDGRAFVKYLDAQPSVDTKRKISTTEYCMTGSYALRLAAAGI